MYASTGELFRIFLNNFSILHPGSYFESKMQKPPPTFVGNRLIQVIAGAFLFMTIGTGMELYLLNHYKDALQLIPLLCIGASLVMLAVLVLRPTPWIIRGFQLLLGLTALSGLYGAFLHLRANYEFEREMKPTATSWEVLQESLAGALPALAPGSMIVLALIGYACLLLLTPKQ